MENVWEKSRALRRPYTTGTLKYFRITSTTSPLLLMVVSSRPQPLAFDECKLQACSGATNNVLLDESYNLHIIMSPRSNHLFFVCPCFLGMCGFTTPHQQTNKKAFSTGTNSRLFPSWCSTSSTRCATCKSTLMVLCRSDGKWCDTHSQLLVFWMSIR